jgi:hypothetical protein
MSILKSLALTLNLLLAVLAIPCSSQPINDNCENAIQLQLGESQSGTTIGATPDPNLVGMNSNTPDVWYWMDNVTNKLLYVCVAGVGFNQPEVGICTQPTIRCNISTDDFLTSCLCMGLGWNRAQAQSPVALVYFTDTEENRTGDALIIIKDTEPTYPGDFKIQTGNFDRPLVDAGPRTEIFCLNNGIRTHELNGTATPTNNGVITEYRWRVVREHHGIVESITPNNNTHATIKFGQDVPIRVDVVLEAYEDAPVKCQNYTMTARHLTGRDTITLIGEAPKLNFKDTIEVCCNQPTTLFDQGTEPVCLGAEPNWQWRPTTGFDNPNIRNPVITICENRTYTVTMTCGECVAQELVFIKACEEPKAIHESTNSPVKVYLAGEYLWIKLTNLDNRLAGFDLYDNRGREVYHQVVSAEVSRLNADMITNGIYFYTITYGGKITTNKILVMR